MYGGGSYGYGMGGGYGYGAAGYGQAAAGGGGAPDNRFIHLAEEYSRPAFETIQSIVNTFGSISMMFESTYYALHSSFRLYLKRYFSVLSQQIKNSNRYDASEF